MLRKFLLSMTAMAALTLSGTRAAEAGECYRGGRGYYSSYRVPHRYYGGHSYYRSHYHHGPTIYRSHYGGSRHYGGHPYYRSGISFSFGF
ncbi:MAG: hypothetical protein MK171_07185 [Pirellulales bacterium]|nr:hypothetical protein [Pirellulales bacterium]